MELNDFIKTHNVDFSYSRVDESFITEMERILDVKVGEQLKKYIIDYGYIGYEYIELFGVNNIQGIKSDMIQQTIFLHEKFDATNGLIAIEDQGDGDYYLVDSEDAVYRFIAGSKQLSAANLSFDEYLIKRLLSV